jgi:small subunit ribosomal protein S18
MAKAAPKRGKNKDNARRSKKKISVLTQEKVEYVDYKDVNLLRRFMSDRAKIRARRVTGNDSQQQKEIARAIKNAREMALLPYTNRVTTQRGGGRGGRDRDGDGDRGDRGDRRDRGPRRGESETTLATATAETTSTPTTPPPGGGGGGNGAAEVTA